MSEVGLMIGESFSGDDPFALFGRWMEEAEAAEPNDPNAVALATVDEDGMPNVRMVLLKGLDAAGFIFFTNYESAKGRELQASHKAAMCFHWKSLRRQVRVRGAIESVSDEEANAYFATRPRGSQIGAWASQQSRQLESREALQEAVDAVASHYGDDEIPRPSHWSGFRLKPQTIEFWHDMPYRLHDRVVFTRNAEDWAQMRLFP